MDDKLYSITLADGTVLDNLRRNGTNYISTKPVSPDIFMYNCSPVIVSDGEVNYVHPNAELVHVLCIEDEYWIAFRDISEAELALLRIKSDIEYLAMMSDVEL